MVLTTVKADKFQVSIISKDTTISGITLQINDVILKGTELVNLLGATIENKLTFHQHISDLCRRANYQLYTLSRFSGVLGIESKLKPFNAFIVSIFMYCPQICYLYIVTDTRKIAKIQENALHFFYNDYYKSYKTLLSLSSRDYLYKAVKIHCS